MIGLNLSGTARRFIGVLFLIPIILAVWFDSKIASIVVAILAVGMAFEFSKMLKTRTILAILSALLIAMQSVPLWVFDGGVLWHSGLAVLSFGITLICSGILAGLFALVLSVCLYFAALLLHQPDGHWLLLVLAAVVAACDSAAYFIGRSVGGIKLAPKISPNKTVSGSVGGIVAAIAVMAVLIGVPALTPIAGVEPITSLDLGVALCVGCGVAVLSQDVGLRWLCGRCGFDALTVVMVLVIHLLFRPLPGPTYFLCLAKER